MMAAAASGLRGLWEFASGSSAAPEWACPDCTLLNRASALRCGACDRPAPVAPAPQAAAGEPAGPGAAREACIASSSQPRAPPGPPRPPATAAGSSSAEPPVLQQLACNDAASRMKVVGVLHVGMLQDEDGDVADGFFVEPRDNEARAAGACAGGCGREVGPETLRCTPCGCRVCGGCAEAAAEIACAAAAAAGEEQPTITAPCPACRGGTLLANESLVALLAPGAYSAYAEGASQRFLQQCVRCPACSAAVECTPQAPSSLLLRTSVPEFDRTAPPTTLLGLDGVPLTREAQVGRTDGRGSKRRKRSSPTSTLILADRPSLVVCESAAPRPAPVPLRRLFLQLLRPLPLLAVPLGLHVRRSPAVARRAAVPLLR